MKRRFGIAPAKAETCPRRVCSASTLPYYLSRRELSRKAKGKQDIAPKVGGCDGIACPLQGRNIPCPEGLGQSMFVLVSSADDVAPISVLGVGP